MIQKINSPISVEMFYDLKEKNIYPRKVVWNGRIYSIVKLGLHHSFKKGNVLYHVFSVVSKTLFFKLVLNTETLHWHLEQIADEY